KDTKEVRKNFNTPRNSKSVVLMHVVEGLFQPTLGEEARLPMLYPPGVVDDWSPELEVSNEEVTRVVLARIWRGVYEEFAPRRTGLYDRCLA
ncbi:unnamed protein product, partial [Heterotrigona itama]